MSTQTVIFSESTSSSRSQTVTIPNLKKVNNATVNTGSVTHSESGNDVTVNVSGGAYTRYTSSPYYPTTTKTDSRSTSAGGDPATLPSSISYDDGSYSGSLSKSGTATVTSGTASGSKTGTDYRTTVPGGSVSTLPNTIPYSDSDGYSGTLSRGSQNPYVVSGTDTYSYITATHTETYTTAKQRWKWSGSQMKWNTDGAIYNYPTTYNYSDADGYAGVINAYSTSYSLSPPSSAGMTSSDDGVTTTQSGLSITVTFSGQASKMISDTRVWRNDYSGTVTKGDTRVWTQSYSGTVTAKSASYSYTYYYAYTVSLDYDVYQPPTPPTITYPTVDVVISASPTTITWTAGTDVETAISSLKYEIDISLDGGSTYTNIVALTNAGVTSYVYDFLQKADSNQVKLRMRTYDGSMYSTYSYSPLFAITHNLAPTASLFLDGSSINNNELSLISDTNDIIVSFTPTDSTGDTLQYSIFLRDIEKIPYTPVAIGETVDFTILNSDLLLGNNIVLIKIKDNHNAENIYTITLRNKTSETISQHDVLTILQSMGYTNTSFVSLQMLKPDGYTGKLSLSDIINFLS